MGRSFFPEAVAAGVVSILCALYAPESVPINAPAHRLCTYLDFFQMVPGIRIGSGPRAKARKLLPCVDIDEEFWQKLAAGGLSSEFGNGTHSDTRVPRLLLFLGNRIRDMAGTSLLLQPVPDGVMVISIVHQPHDFQWEER